MKLKGLVWFFTIALTIISLWELSYTWVVRNYENTVTAKATKIVKTAFPGLKGDDKEAAIEYRKKRILDSTAEQKIYPLFGTTYKQCKANELNLGLDLQGGISVTLDVSLSELLKSLSNNSKDTALLKAIKAATLLKNTRDENYINLFTESYINQNGPGKLASIFAGAEKEVKINDNDAAVKAKLKTISAGAIKETYKILVRRIDKFGVAQPNINFDENKGIINVELAGVTDVDRVRKLLQASAHLQFWEVYRIDELANSLKIADENLQNYLNGVKDTGKVDSAKLLENVNPFFRVINPQNPQTDPATGKQSFASSIGNVAVQDTAVFYEYLNNDVVKNAIPADCKFLLGVEEKADKGNQHFLQ